MSPDRINYSDVSICQWVPVAQPGHQDQGQMEGLQRKEAAEAEVEVEGRSSNGGDMVMIKVSRFEGMENVEEDKQGEEGAPCDRYLWMNQQTGRKEEGLRPPPLSLRHLISFKPSVEDTLYFYLTRQSEGKCEQPSARMKLD